MDEWHIGDPVDWGDGFMDAQNWGHEDDETPPTSQSTTGIAQKLTDEAWNLRNKGKYSEALSVINRAIESYPNHPNPLNTKAIILQDMHEYEKALEFYDRALALSRDNVIRKNKASCILDMLDARKYRGNITCRELNLINEALKLLPPDADNYSYLQCKGEILERLDEPVKAKICYLLSNKLFDKVNEAEKQLKQLKKPGETYIIITGTDQYENSRPFKKGVVIDLVRETENKYDPDAIRAEINGKTVGYVANSKYALIKEVKSATDIKYKNPVKAEFVFILLETYVIARLIKTSQKES